MKEQDLRRKNDLARDEAFLERWSRRKAEARAEFRPGEQAQPLPAAADAEAARETVLTDADMPDIASIDEHTDISPFFSPGVSEALRRRALRYLFRLPRFGVRDGLDDYDGDYRSFTPLGAIETADMKFDRERLARLAQQQLAGESEQVEAAEGEMPPAASAAETENVQEIAARDGAPAAQDTSTEGDSV